MGSPPPPPIKSLCRGLREGGRSMLQVSCPSHLKVALPHPQGWTDTETTAAWGAAQQASGQSFCSQNLEDGELKASSSPQVQRSKTPKVPGPSTCRPMKGQGARPSSLRGDQKGRLAVCTGLSECPHLHTSQFPLAFLEDDVTLRHL